MSHELLIAVITTLIGAFISLIGSGAVILISLFPTEITGNRDNYQRVAKIWGLLVFDIKRINTLCQNHMKAIQEALHSANTNNNILPLLTFVRVPTTAWQTILTSGDFMSEVSQQVLNKLTEGYLAVDTLNDTIDHYSSYVATSRSNADFGATVLTFYTVESQNCSTIISHFQALDQQIAVEEKVNAQKAISQQKRVKIIKWFGIILFVIVTVLIVLAVIVAWKSLAS